MPTITIRARLLLGAALLAFAATACDERGPAIDFTQRDASLQDTTFVLQTVPAAQPRAVLIEDFTGVQCVNCPRGHDFITAAIAQNAGRVTTLAIHSAQGIFSTPIEGITNHDFRLPEANAMDALIGNSQAWPSLAFDRTPFAGSRFVSLVGWEDALAQRLAVPTPVNITMEQVAYDAATRSVTLRVTTTYTADQTEADNFTLALTESQITEPQKNSQLQGNSDVDTFYVHNHVLRGLLTPATGEALAVPDRLAGRTRVRVYRTTLKPDWDVNNVEAVAVVHRAGQSGALEVLQSAALKLKP